MKPSIAHPTGHRNLRLIVALTVLLFALALVIFGLTGSAYAQQGANAANLDQCRNGTVDSPADCTDDPAAPAGLGWVNGNANGQQANYAEGETIPYRIRFQGLDAGQHVVNIQYDFTDTSAGRHAIDYLTSYNRTETTADACAGVLTPAECANATTLPIPVDPVLATCETSQHIPAVDGGLPQVPGEFKLYNGTLIDAQYIGTHACEGASLKVDMQITFSVDSADADAVLAFGGHIAGEFDWGNGRSAGSINGSPYHMAVKSLDGASTGAQDVNLQATAIYGIDLTTNVQYEVLGSGFPLTDQATIAGTLGSNVVTTPALSGTLNFYVCSDTTEPYGPPFANGCAHNAGEFVGSTTVKGNGTYLSPAFTPQQNGYYCFRSEFIPDGEVYPMARETNAMTAGDTAECVLISNPTSVTISDFSASSSTGRLPIAMLLGGGVALALAGGTLFLSARKRSS